jgi:hypothetical protein
MKQTTATKIFVLLLIENIVFLVILIYCKFGCKDKRQGKVKANNHCEQLKYRGKQQWRWRW